MFVFGIYHNIQWLKLLTKRKGRKKNKEVRLATVHMRSIGKKLRGIQLKRDRFQFQCPVNGRTGSGSDHACKHVLYTKVDCCL